MSKQASEEIIAAVNDIVKKYAGILQAIKVPAAVGLGAGGLGFLGGKIHEKSKDEVEDKKIAQYFLNLGYRAAAEAMNNRLTGGENVTP